MSAHLSPDTLNALVDGELRGAELEQASEHLATCLSCSSECLSYGILKRGVASQRRRYPLPGGLEGRMATLIAPAPRGQQTRALWTVAAAVLVICAGALFVSRNDSRQASLIGEVYDRHLATLAANVPPQVVSSDRHTVKPWFQGKLPFSFNLPQTLPADTTLDGANLTYIAGHPVAQLLLSVGKHRVSIFVAQSSLTSSISASERSGYHVRGFRTSELELVAVSDLEADRLAQLVTTFQAAQAAPAP